MSFKWNQQKLGRKEEKIGGCLFRTLKTKQVTACLDTKMFKEEQMVYEGYFPNGALLFTEYTSDFPHVPYTVGFNHVGGPIFYFNVEDNTEMHGPQVSEEEGNKEGDPCFAKIVEGIDVVQRIAQMPKTASDSLESLSS